MYKRSYHDKVLRFENDKFWHLRTIKEVYEETSSSKTGLKSVLVHKRYEKEGPNLIASTKKEGPIKQFFLGFHNILIYILFIACLISLFSNHLIEFVVILIIIFLTVILSFIQERRASHAIEALSKYAPKRVDVIRDSKKHTIDPKHLVTGDLVVIEPGMIIPADLRLVLTNSLMINESILTGESIPRSKNSNKIDEQDLLISERTNIAYAGTSVTKGSGLGIVVEKGLNSEIGKISAKMKSLSKNKSPLQRKIDGLSKTLSIYVIIIAAILLVYLILTKADLVFSLILVGAIVVAGIPESLPLALTLALTSGVEKMAKKNAIVRDLSSVETLGTTTVICTDKTGTLTTNKMVVEKIVFSNLQSINVHGNGYEPRATFTHDHKKYSSKEFKKNQFFFRTAILCNNAELFLENGSWILKGDPTEGALLAVSKSAGYSEEVVREDNKRFLEIPFDNEKKYMISVNNIGTKNKQVLYAHMKGAIEHVVDMCSFYRGKDGKIIKLNKSYKNKILELAEKNGEQSLRVLGFATKKVTKNQLKNTPSGYVFEGFMCLHDPLRDDVVQSIKECHDSGVKIVMITGDHINTASSIGHKLGLFKPHRNLIILGTELDDLSDEDLDKIISKVVIFARTTPDHKLRIVSSLQRNWEVVAMTGDGVNDAPALKKADIGISMGASGTEVAREASNLILTDDKFSTIVNAIKEGRTIYSNIRRFIYYLLTGNFSEVAIIVFAILFQLSTPLTALMILFVNFVTSTLPAMALSIEPTHMKVMKQKPRNPRESLLSKYILLKILVLIPILLVGTLLLFVWQLDKGVGLGYAQTVVFATIILFEIFHAFNARSLHSSIFNKHFFSNKYLFIAVGVSLALMLLSIYTEFGQSIFGTLPLMLSDWVAIFLVALLVLIVSEVIKLMTMSEFEEQEHLKGLRVELE